MKIFALILSCVLLLGAGLSGCRSNIPQETNGSIVPDEQTKPSTKPTELTVPTMPMGMAESSSAKVLQNIWDKYPEAERFAVYGGAVEQSVADGPGDLDMSVTEELTTRYLLPEAQLGMVKEGASLVHLMNNNIFTAVVFGLADNTDVQGLAKAWRDSIHGTRWVCGQPDRMIMAQLENNHILMAFGSQDAMTAFRGRVAEAYPTAGFLYEEAIVA
ncbi:MAG: hypothetical protein E7439_04695 [Ruminococcaceae bacterium]|nr:hypothetical protein [Oscillospiraceae bacterium]